MTISYIRVVKVFNQTNGAFNSQNFLEKTFAKNGISNKKILIFPVLKWLRLFLSLKFLSADEANLIAVNHKSGLYHKFIRRINYVILTIWLTRQKELKTIILDGLIPTTHIVKNYKYISIVRSSPQCLVFSEMDGRRDHLLQSQLQLSKAIVSASPDAIDSWKSYGYFLDKKMLQLPVPMPKILEPSLKVTNTKIDDFLCGCEQTLNVIIFGGNMGPRKGLIPLCDELSKLDAKKFKLKVFGSYDNAIEELCASYNFEIDLLGYQEVDFLQPSEKNVLRVYPALSECMSPIQLQGLFSGDTTMIYRRGLEPILNKWIGSNVIFESFSEISEFIKDNKYNFRSMPPNQRYANEYRILFEAKFNELLEYAKNL